MIQTLLKDGAEHCPKLMMEGWASKKRAVLKGHVVRKLAGMMESVGEGPQKKGDLFLWLK